MRRESVATLRVGNWKANGAPERRVKGARSGYPVPALVMRYLICTCGRSYTRVRDGDPRTRPSSGPSWGKRRSAARGPMTGKNIWRLCKV